MKDFWIRQVTQNEDDIGRTHFFYLLCALCNNSTSGSIQKQVADVDRLFQDDLVARKELWSKSVGGFEQGQTPFYLLLDAISSNNSISDAIQKQVADVDCLFQDDLVARKELWSNVVEGDDQGKTPFYLLLTALIKNPKSEMIEKIVSDVDALFQDDLVARKRLWSKEVEGYGPEVGQTPFSLLLCALCNNPESEEMQKLISGVDSLLKDDSVD